jgi:hypothetical protein
MTINRLFPQLSDRIAKLAIALICALCLTGLFASPSHALTQITLSDLSYHECSKEMAEGTVSAGTSVAASCYIITGTAENASGKPVLNADIFGRIYDANGNSVMQNRTRLGAIEEVPPGKSPFELRISVPANQPTPLKLEQFKASGFTGKVRR